MVSTTLLSFLEFFDLIFGLWLSKSSRKTDNLRCVESDKKQEKTWSFRDERISNEGNDDDLLTYHLPL